MDLNHNKQQQQMNSGLARYRSAPSSYFSNLINAGMYEDEDVDPFFNSMVSVPRISNLDQYIMDSMKQEHDAFISRSQQHQQQQQQQQQQQPQQQQQQQQQQMIYRNHEHSLKVVDHNTVETTYASSFDGGYWDDSGMLNDVFMKAYGGIDRKMSSKTDEGRVGVSTGLTHQLSLPTSSSELTAMENIMQFQDGVQLKSRAKRGCATHPRSIAERVRRTRISERIRMLQDLVPNMEKQTNTADMLDLAIDYIKKLQKQLVTLSDHHAMCTCQHTQKLTQHNFKHRYDSLLS